MQWFFHMKVVLVIATLIGTTAAMVTMAHGGGNMWDQKAQVSGPAKSWLILAFMMSFAGGWSTMATNIPDFTRYLSDQRGTYWQAVFVPTLALIVTVFGMVCTSAGKIVYGSYIWSPTDLAAEWTSSGGRAGAFFVGFSWVNSIFSLGRKMLI
jgi:NCS1 family nucleobase:cation symporter-1